MAAALALMLGSTGAAHARHNALELVSAGSKADTGQFAATFLRATADGRKAFFLTSEQLVAADTNGSDDVYMREGGATTLISTGPTGRSGGVQVSEHRGALVWFDVSADGERVFFTTDAALVAADADTNYDVYERTGGQTSLISSGSTARCAFESGCDAFLGAASDDGSRVVFITGEGLTPQDTDGVCVDSYLGDFPCYDVYEHSAGTTKVVSFGSQGGNGGPHGEGDNVDFAGASADGARIFFSTREPLEPGDTDIDCITDLRRGPAAMTYTSAPPAS